MKERLWLCYFNALSKFMPDYPHKFQHRFSTFMTLISIIAIHGIVTANGWPWQMAIIGWAVMLFLYLIYLITDDE